MVAQFVDSRFLDEMTIFSASTSHVAGIFRSGCRTVSGVGWMVSDLSQIAHRSDLYAGRFPTLVRF